MPPKKKAKAKTEAKQASKKQKSPPETEDKATAERASKGKPASPTSELNARAKKANNNQDGPSLAPAAADSTLDRDAKMMLQCLSGTAVDSNSKSPTFPSRGAWPMRCEYEQFDSNAFA